MEFTKTPWGTELRDESGTLLGFVTETLNDKYFYYQANFNEYRNVADSEDDARRKLRYLIYKQVILSNSMLCHNCKDIIWSAHRHDYKTCSCGMCVVDGGQEYLRGSFHKNGTELSVCWDEVLVKHLLTLDLVGLDAMKTLLTVEKELIRKGYTLQEKLEWKTHLDPSELDLHNKNTFGIICSVARYYRDQGLELVRNGSLELL